MIFYHPFSDFNTDQITFTWLDENIGKGKWTLDRENYDQITIGSSEDAMLFKLRFGYEVLYPF